MVEYKVQVYDDKMLWSIDGKLHREDGPAFETLNETYFSWHKHGKLHREDGPAVYTESGYKSWWYEGERHREDGPAVEWPDGVTEYWLDGEEYTMEEFLLIANKRKPKPYAGKKVIIDGYEYILE